MPSSRTASSRECGSMVVPAASSARAPMVWAPTYGRCATLGSASTTRRLGAVPTRIIAASPSPSNATRSRRLVVIRASTDDIRGSVTDANTDVTRTSDPPPAAGAYQGWWTRADAAAALVVLQEMDSSDDDAVRVEDCSRALAPPAAPWLELVELISTFGAAGGGLAAVFLQETALCTLVAALPVVAWGARRQRDSLSRAFSAEILIEAREEARCANAKARLGVARADAVDVAAKAVATLVNESTRATVIEATNKVQFDMARVVQASTREVVAKQDVADANTSALNERFTALNSNIQNASTSALRAAKESGAVAGMLAKDVASARVDQRESFELLAGLVAESLSDFEQKSSSKKDDVVLEIEALCEVVSGLEKTLVKVLVEKEKNTTDPGGVRTEAGTTVGSSGVTGVTTADDATTQLSSSALNESELKKIAELASASAAQLQILVDAAVTTRAAAVAAERAAAAADRVSGGGAYGQLVTAGGENKNAAGQIVAKLDAAQWGLLGDRLTQLETRATEAAAEATREAGKAVGRVRAGVREDIRGATEALAAEFASARASASETEVRRTEVVSPSEARRRERGIGDAARPPEQRLAQNESAPTTPRFVTNERPTNERQSEFESPRVEESRRRPTRESRRREERESQRQDLTRPQVPSGGQQKKKQELPNGLPFEFVDSDRVPVGAEDAMRISAFGRLTVAAAKSNDTDDVAYVPPMNSGKGITKAEAFENMQALLRGRTRVIGGSVGDIESRGGVTDVSETETSAEESYEVSSEESSKESSEESSEESSSDESSSSSSSSSSETAFPETAKPVRVRLEVDEKKGYVTVGIVLNDESTTSVEASEKVGDGSSDGDDDVANVDEVERIPDDPSIASEADSPTSSSDLNDTTPRGLLKEGLAKLRVARHSANEADGVPQSMLVADNEMNDAIDLLSAAADGFEELVEGETDLTLGDDSSSLCAAARGNLGNALLSRGRLQLRLSKLAYAQERNARANGVRAGADGAAQFHEETAEECFVLAGRAFKASLNLSGGPGNGSGSSRALCGWGSALALRGQMAYQTSALVSAAALACAACEKYRSALELDADDTGVQSVESVNTSTGGYVTTREATSSFTVQSKAAAFLDWGDALQLAAKASSKALTESRRNGFNTGADAENGYVQLVANLPSPGECWSKAELCYEQAARWDTQPGGEISDAAARGARACRDATR